MKINYLSYFTLIFGTIEYQNSKNKSLLLYISLLLHYALYYILYLLPLNILVSPKKFSKKFLIWYIALLVLTRISWIIFDNKCVLTLWTNKMTNRGKESGFRDPFSIITGTYPTVGGSDNISFRDKIYIWWLYIGIIISLRFYMCSKK